MNHRTPHGSTAPGVVSAALVLVFAAVLSAGGAGAARAAVHTRQEIHKLTATQIANYQKGVALMQSRAANDPTSWIYQANIHGYPPPGDVCPVVGTPQPAWGTCQHQSFFFLAWHRMYLYYFERILRAAVRQAIHNPTYDFGLPFWDYENPSFHDLPSPFRVPANSSNSLYIKERRAACNNGQQCVSASDASDTVAMGLIPFCSCTGASCTGCTLNLPPNQSFGGGFIPSPSHFGGQSGQLELQPHNVVHVAVGGNTGWMSYVECAARDPIFWVHHANIDRLWQVWLNKLGGRKNPISNSKWATQTFTFFDENKKQVTLTGCQIVNMATQLDYRYEGVPVNNVQLCGTAKAVPELAAPAAPPPRALAATAAETTLGKAPVSVKVALPADTRQHLRSLTAAAVKPGRLWLQIEGVQQLHAGAIYQVYLNLPAGQKPDPASRYFLGNIALFEETGHSAEETWTFDLAARIKAMGAKEDVQLTFVREELGPPEPGEPETFLRFNKVSVLER
jgi:tyrosinase